MGGNLGETWGPIPRFPWIWNVPLFDSRGGYSVKTQIFPSYYIYENGSLVKKVAQHPDEDFIQLNSSNTEIKAADIK